MAFSDTVKKEILKEIPSKSCCRRALLYGILFDAETDGDLVIADTRDAEVSEFYNTLFRRQLAKDIESSVITKAGRKYYQSSFRLRSLASRIGALECEGAAMKDYMEFKCASCKMNFVRGLFLSRASLTFEAGNNHLEFRIRHASRAQALDAYLSACGAPPRTVKRAGAIGLYYKKADSIEDVLNLMCLKDSLFEVINKRIERTIVIEENRAVNCESVNILRTVESAQKQLRAIEIIEGEGLLDKLGSDLTESARLRLENHSASLSELAQMHEKPISKTVLANRFAKIIKMSENIQNKKSGGK